jgi:hypothetical protein
MTDHHKPASPRSARVMESRARAQRERAAMALDFCDRLTREVASDGTIAQQMLIQSAASAATEVAVLSGKFLRCAASAAELDRLGRARSELNRTLRLLGIAPRRAGESDTAPKLAEWLVQPGENGDRLRTVRIRLTASHLTRSLNCHDPGHR